MFAFDARCVLAFDSCAWLGVGAGKASEAVDEDLCQAMLLDPFLDVPDLLTDGTRCGLVLARNVR